MIYEASVDFKGGGPKTERPLLALPFNKQDMPSKIDPPCIGICTINKDGICIGCKRTVKEIHKAYLKSIDQDEEE